MLNKLQIRDIRSLQIFTEVVDSGGISAAQDSLGMTQSNISAQLLDLETRLGAKLCDRGRAGFRVTEEGAEVYATTRSLLADLADYQDRLQSIGSGLRGELLIGHMDHYLSHPEGKLVDALQHVAGLSADIYFNLRTASMESLQHALANSDIQLAIGTFTTFDGAVEYYEIHQEQQILCCSGEHPLVQEIGEPSRAQVASAGYARALYGYGQDSEVLDNCLATVHQVESMTAFILSGRGVGYIPDHVARPFIHSGHMVNLLPDEFAASLPVYLAVRIKSLESPLVERFVRLFLGLSGISFDQTKGA
ncbi:MAG: LysR family transcriptional regulator [Halioglobus sp.]